MDNKRDAYAMAFRVLRGDSTKQIASDFETTEEKLIELVEPLREDISKILMNTKIIHRKIELKQKINYYQRELDYLAKSPIGQQKVENLLIGKTQEVINKNPFQKEIETTIKSIPKEINPIKDKITQLRKENEDITSSEVAKILKIRLEEVNRNW